MYHLIATLAGAPLLHLMTATEDFVQLVALRILKTLSISSVERGALCLLNALITARTRFVVAFLKKTCNLSKRQVPNAFDLKAFFQRYRMDPLELFSVIQRITSRSLAFEPAPFCIQPSASIAGDAGPPASKSLLALPKSSHVFCFTQVRVPVAYF